MFLRRVVVCLLPTLLVATSSSVAEDYVVDGGRPVRLGYYYAVDPTCTSMGEPTIRLIEGPRGGQAEVRHGRDYPNFPTSNVRSRCDTHKVPVTEIIYHSAPGFTGADEVTYEVVFPLGRAHVFHASVSVR